MTSLNVVSYRRVFKLCKTVENVKNKVTDPKRAQDKQSILTAEEQIEYRQFIGQNNWAVQGTRPDMAFELMDLSTKLKGGTISDLSRAIKAVNRPIDIRSMISFPGLSRNIDVAGRLWSLLMHSFVISIMELEVQLDTSFS